jgi:hypothetical protein
MEAEVSYLVQHSRPMIGGPQQFEKFPDAAQAAWRLAVRCGAAVVVDDRQPTIPVGRTRRWENRLQPHEPVVIFDDLRPDAAEKAAQSLAHFRQRVARAEERERFAAPIRAAWAEL